MTNQITVTPISSLTHKAYYCYTYQHCINHLDYPDFLLCKVGETFQGIDANLDAKECTQKRKDQQGGAAEAKKKIPIYEFFHKISSTFKTDRNLHKVILKTKGLRPKSLDGLGTEWFYLPYNANDMVPFETTIKFLNNCVEELDGKVPRKFLKLKQMQEEKLQEVLAKCEDFADGKISNAELMNLIAMLFPRFGKTIWALELFRRLNAQFGMRVMILPAYELSSHTSFEKEIRTFEEFRSLEFINAYDFRDNVEFESKLDEVFNAGKLPVISVSMHATNVDIFKPLRDLDCGDIFMFIDEADRGAWTEKSRKIVNYILNI